MNTTSTARAKYILVFLLVTSLQACSSSNQAEESTAVDEAAVGEIEAADPLIADENRKAVSANEIGEE